MTRAESERRIRSSRVIPYGVPADAGDYRCVDCGRHYVHAARKPLPPCPRYQDSTHARAGWRFKDDVDDRDRPAAGESTPVDRPPGE